MIFSGVYGYTPYGFIVYGLPYFAKPSSTADTHDGLPRKFYLPIYGELEEAVGNIRFIKKSKPKDVVLRQPVVTAKAAYTEEVKVPAKLAEYDIDWKKIEREALAQNVRLDALLRMIDEMRMAYEKEQEDEMLLILVATLT
jgi:hypothetical protein